jgi:hypothetical protein
MVHSTRAMSKSNSKFIRKQSSAELYLNEQHKIQDSGGRKQSSTNSRLKKNYSLQDNLNGNSTNNSSGNFEELGTISELDSSACSCTEHSGVVRLNQVYELEIDHLYNCLFGYNEFHVAFAQLRKISGLSFFGVLLVLVNLLTVFFLWTVKKPKNFKS